MASFKSNIDKLSQLLNSLQKVRKIRDGQYLACCPAHDDKSPSLSIKLLSDERILIHCFGGCETENILDAIGMTFSDLMPENVGNHKRVSKLFYASDILQILAYESSLVYFYALDLSKGKSLSEEDRKRLLLSISRIRYARSMADV